MVKPFLQQITDLNAVLTLDDPVEPKPYMDTEELRKLKTLQAENARLKKLLADVNA